MSGEVKGMPKNKLGMSVMISHPDNPAIEKQIPIFARQGFDSFFLSCGVTEEFCKIPQWSASASENGIQFEAVHAPTAGVDSFWLAGDSFKDYFGRIKQIIDACSKGAVGKLVMHVVADAGIPLCDLGPERFALLGEYAASGNVRLCFENSVSYPHLAAVLEHCADFHGFCLDVGHNLCYTPDIDLLEMFGHKMIYTHIHDNFGPYGGDAHLLPFDGIFNWISFARRIRKMNYTGTLNLELAATGSAAYRAGSYEDFVKKAYERLRILENCIGQETPPANSPG